MNYLSLTQLNNNYITHLQIIHELIRFQNKLNLKENKNVQEKMSKM